jgi:hypothetical protein
MAGEKSLASYSDCLLSPDSATSKQRSLMLAIFMQDRKSKCLVFVLLDHAQDFMESGSSMWKSLPGLLPAWQERLLQVLTMYVVLLWASNRNKSEASPRVQASIFGSGLGSSLSS